MHNKEEFMSFRGGEKSKKRFKGRLYLWARAKKTSEIIIVASNSLEVWSFR